MTYTLKTWQTLESDGATITIATLAEALQQYREARRTHANAMLFRHPTGRNRQYYDGVQDGKRMWFACPRSWA